MMRSVVRILCLTAVVAVTGHATGWAQARPQQQRPAAPAGGASAGHRVAVVNSRMVLQQTPGYAAAESTFNREIESYRGEVAKLQTRLDSMASDFEQQSVVLSPTQRTQRRTELETQRQQLEQRAQEIQQKVASRERELLEPINRRVNAVIEGVRAEANYAIVFDVSAAGSGIVAVDRSIDITDRVIQRLKSGS